MLIFNLILVLLLCISYLSIYISPGKFWPISFFGLAYPYLLFLNIFMIIFWINRRKYIFIFSFTAILFGWNILASYIQITSKKNRADKIENSFSLLSYNVRMFNLYKWSNDNVTRSNILKFVKKEKPDIICFQEYYSGIKKDLNLPDSLEIFQGQNYSFSRSQ